MEEFAFKEHDRGVLFEAYGFSFENALENAAGALFSVMAETGKVHEKEKVLVEEKASTLEELAAFVLSDLHDEVGAREIFLKEFKATHFAAVDGAFEFKGTAYGSEAQPEMAGKIVKGVVAEKVKVEKAEKNGSEHWTITVLLDV